DRDDVAVPKARDLRDLHVRLRGERLPDPEQRMVRDELAEHLLLQAEERALVELRPREDGFVDLRGRLVTAAEERELAGGLRLALGGDRRRDLLPRRRSVGRRLRHHAASRVPEGVEAAGEDQALEHLLRQDAGIDLAAEVREGGERAL